jgi:hypothetical protein
MVGGIVGFLVDDCGLRRRSFPRNGQLTSLILIPCPARVFGSVGYWSAAGQRWLDAGICRNMTTRLRSVRTCLAEEASAALEAEEAEPSLSHSQDCATVESRLVAAPPIDHIDQRAPVQVRPQILAEQLNAPMLRHVRPP